MDNEAKVDVVDTQDNGQENNNQEETVSLSKSEYEKLNQTLGSLKRELKDLKKPKEEPVKDSPKADDVLLARLEKLSLNQAGLTHEDDIDLARQTAKKWNMNIEDVIRDEDFKIKLEKQQTSRANTEATSGIKGSASTSQAKLTPEYWLAKGVPPTANDVPDRKARVKIARAFMDNSKSGKKFYND